MRLDSQTAIVSSPRLRRRQGRLPFTCYLYSLRRTACAYSHSRRYTYADLRSREKKRYFVRKKRYK